MTISKETSGADAYPKSIFLIMATEFCERFSFCGLRTILSLYLRDILLFGENKSTIVYHVFIMLCYIIPILGAVFADSFIGRFRTILYFGIVYAFGNILLCFSAIPPFVSEAVVISVLGLLLIATGTGGIKPCVAAFGGDQFRLPQQKLWLEQFFSIYYFTINFGGLMGMVITPLLRTARHCFDNDSCYALGFGFPAALMLLALVLFISGKPFYKIKSPKENIILKFIQCSVYATVQSFHSNSKPKAHCLDYASGKYDDKLISDMKTVLAILFLYIPLPLFWSLNDQQGSRWTFQASRMNGQMFGISVLPDQVQVINPAIVLVLIPFMEKTVYPYLSTRNLLTSPLQRMVIGGFISASSFVASGILELNLEKTYPILPHANESHINFINLMPCTIQLVNPFNRLQTLKPGSNYVFTKVLAQGNTSEYIADIVAPCECGKIYLTQPWRKILFTAHEYQVISKFIYEYDSRIEVSSTKSDNLQKTLSGKPKLRRIALRDKNATGLMTVEIKSYKGMQLRDVVKEGEITIFADTELECGVYHYSVSVADSPKKSMNGTFQVDSGGVYSLVMHFHRGEISFVKLYMLTSPNTIHMLWLLPQYFLISIGEAIFAIAGLQFTFTQAPKSMKTVTLAAWYLSIALGNLLVIIVAQVHFIKSQAYEFFFFAIMVFIDMIVFKIMAANYKFVINDYDDSSSSYATTDGTPLTIPSVPSSSSIPLLDGN